MGEPSEETKEQLLEKVNNLTLLMAQKDDMINTVKLKAKSFIEKLKEDHQLELSNQTTKVLIFIHIISTAAYSRNSLFK